MDGGAKLVWWLALKSRITRELIHTPLDVEPRNSSSFCHASGSIETLRISTVLPLPLPFGRPAPSRRPPLGIRQL